MSPSLGRDLEKFTDEIEGELEKRTICGVHITRGVTMGLLCAASVFIVGLGVVLGTTLGGGGSGSSSSDPLSTQTNQERVMILETELEPLSGSSVVTSGTPQRMALEWLAASDPARLPLKNTPIDVITQRYVMATIYYATGGPEWALQYNFLTGKETCDWNSQPQGVFCNNAGYITAIELNNLNLKGELPKEIALLRQLEAIKIGGNKLSGKVPTELGLLSKLRVLHIGINSFTGGIPTELGGLPQLAILDVSNNDFSGHLTGFITHIHSLESLDISHNGFSGELHKSFGNLKNLKVFKASFNDFTSIIPTQLARMKILEEMYLNSNEFKETLPEEFSGMQHLVTLDVSNNKLTGEIPVGFGYAKSLQALSLSENQFSGGLFTDIGQLGSRLKELRLDNNNLKSFLPTELRSLTNVIELNLEGNEFEGNIPSEIGECTGLKYLSVGNNKLFGNVPTEIENLTGLQILDLSYNNLGGDISTDVGFKLSNLQELYLSGNQIRQDLDPVFCTRPNIYTEFVSDCKLSEVQCTCCTSCCDGGTDTSQCSESS